MTEQSSLFEGAAVISEWFSAASVRAGANAVGAVSGGYRIDVMTRRWPADRAAAAAILLSELSRTIAGEAAMAIGKQLTGHC